MTCADVVAKSNVLLIAMSRGERASFIRHILSCKECKASRRTSVNKRLAGLSAAQAAIAKAAAAKMLMDDCQDPEYIEVVPDTHSTGSRPGEARMAPEDNPADDVQPTREEWDAYEKAREAVPATESPTPGETNMLRKGETP